MDFKNNLKMFQNNSAPPIKPKTVHKNPDLQTKIEIPPKAVILEKSGSLSLKTCLSEEEDGYTDDYTYKFCDSIYDIPGFEHFYFDGSTTKVVTNVEEEVPTMKTADEDVTKDSPLVVDQKEIIEDVDSKLAPSPRLIEEIFNNSIWRNSNHLQEDDDITAQTTVNPRNLSIVEPESIVNIEERKKTQILGRRSLFGSIFKSNRSKKKSAEKLAMKDNSDTDSLQESPMKKKTSVTNIKEDDTHSLDRSRTKPLNSIFNRDWLNSIGDGIKKKASVMSELRKVFSHGKFKDFKKKSPKSGTLQK